MKNAHVVIDTRTVITALRCLNCGAHEVLPVLAPLDAVVKQAKRFTASHLPCQGAR